MDKCCFETFEELFDLISQHKIKNIFTLKKSKTEQFQTILFVYQHLFDFPGNNNEVKVFVSKIFFNSILNILYSDCVLHHSHVTGKIIG